MEAIYLIIVAFLLILAVFDLTIGVSNDAVNFLNSAIGAKAAKFRTIMIIAGIGILLGASMSNGMMEISRHGIFHPEYFYFNELMCIFLAVMVTDVVLLDMFNSLGMPTSTTVSMVFELLGGAFAMALIKVASEQGDFGFGELLNTEKALSVIAGIFLSVAIAFIFGTVVQWFTRIIFTFNYKKHLRWTIGIFGGLAITSIFYFMLVKGLKGSTIMTAEMSNFIENNTILMLAGMFVVFSILMQILHLLKVNVLKIVVLMGTFALAMAFAGNDLVNFIGVPLAGLASYTYYMSDGSGDYTSYLMDRLNEPAGTPIYFLAGAGIIMVIALFTSKKAQNVVKTSIDLSKQSEGDEIFGSSKIARSIVRYSTNAATNIGKIVPSGISDWINSRFEEGAGKPEDGAAFDLVRASINLVLAGLLIALGTSLKLPLSTTYVAFMVAMGTSLADRAWGRESAVFRITGVISVIGGWFITAGAAFILCFTVTNLMYFGGFTVMGLMILLVIYLLIRSNIRYKKKAASENTDDPIFRDMMKSNDSKEIWTLLQTHFAKNVRNSLDYTIGTYSLIIDSFINEDLKGLRRVAIESENQKQILKTIRKREMLGLRKSDTRLAVENNTWLHLGCNSCTQMVYCLKRINEPCREHVDNNFTPMPATYIKELLPLRDKISAYLIRGNEIILNDSYQNTQELLDECELLKTEISAMRKKLMDSLQTEVGSMQVAMVYLNLLQESQELVSTFRHLMRAVQKFETAQ